MLLGGGWRARSVLDGIGRGSSSGGSSVSRDSVCAALLAARSVAGGENGIFLSYSIVVILGAGAHGGADGLLGEKGSLLGGVVGGQDPLVLELVPVDPCRDGDAAVAVHIALLAGDGREIPPLDAHE